MGQPMKMLSRNGIEDQVEHAKELKPFPLFKNYCEVLVLTYSTQNLKQYTKLKLCCHYNGILRKVTKETKKTFNAL
jgi:hypothetical protein